MALRVLEGCGLDLAPRVVGQPGADRIRHTWLPGHPMRPAGLRREQLRTWVGRAAHTIGIIQRATARHDGTVLVHGDYWLGNLLVDGDEVVAVLDWTRAHWGEPTEDVRHLVDHLVEMGLASGHEAAALRELASAGAARSTSSSGSSERGGDHGHVSR
jgi:aminoglycoside phosphotransferase (APT) family kinase protein